MEVPEIRRVGVVGAGTMGGQIALWCAVHGKEAYLFDVSPEALTGAISGNEARLREAVRAGVIPPLTADEVTSIISRVRPCDTLKACVENAELVIEVVPENVELKRQVFAEIDRLAPPEALIATSSSSLPCSRMADATGRPEKVLNLHFPHPRTGAPLEVMGNPDTTPETLAAGEAFVRSLGMLPIMVKREIMGFGLNVIWREVKRAALHIVAGGYIDFEDIDRWWMTGLGAPAGIFSAMDHIGLDIVRDIEMQYYRESGDARDKPPELLDKMIAQGRLGVKSGRGFYTYPDPEYERPGWLQKQPPWTPDMTIKLENLIS